MERRGGLAIGGVMDGEMGRARDPMCNEWRDGECWG